MAAKTSTVNMNAESGSHGNYGVWWKNCSASHRIPIPLTICTNGNVITVLVLYFREKLLINRCICAIFLQMHQIQSSVVWYTKVVNQNMSEKSILEAVKNCLVRRPKVYKACIKQFHLFVIKHRVMSGMFWQWLNLGNILQRTFCTSSTHTTLVCSCL